MKNINSFGSARARLDELWANGAKQNIKCNAEKICIVYTEYGGDFINPETMRFEKSVQTLIAFDRWSDTGIFHQVVNGKYIPNKIGQHIGIAFTSGSAHLKMQNEKELIDLALSKIEAAGYKVFYKNLILNK